MNARIVIKLGVKMSSNIKIYESNFIDLKFLAPNFRYIVYMEIIWNNEERQFLFMPACVYHTCTFSYVSSLKCVVTNLFVCFNIFISF